VVPAPEKPASELGRKKSGRSASQGTEEIKPADGA